MVKILKREKIAEGIHEMVVEAPLVAEKAMAGQFVVVMAGEEGERIPLTIADFDGARGTITMIFMVVGTSTEKLARLNAGDFLNAFIGPMGSPSEIASCGTVVMVGGGVGIAPIHPIARSMKEAGNKVISIIGSRTSELLFWEEKMRAVSDRVIVCTDDGSHGRKTLVTVPLKELMEEGGVGEVYAIGPPVMMKFCSETTRPFGVKTIVSLNSIMVDATGMCGGCRVTVGGRTRFTCVDGPEFDGHQVDWDLLTTRLNVYRGEEKCSLDRYLKEVEG